MGNAVSELGKLLYFRGMQGTLTYTFLQGCPNIRVLKVGCLKYQLDMYQNYWKVREGPQIYFSRVKNHCETKAEISGCV